MKTASSKRTQQTTTRVAGAFAKYDGCRFAVVLPHVNRKPFRGRARYERDDLLGPVLRIPLEGDCPGNPDILLVEQEWNGLITPDDSYGCDYCVTLIPETKQGK